MEKKINLFGSINITYQHVEFLLILITFAMGAIVVYFFKDKIERKMIEKYTNNKKLYLFYAEWCSASRSFLPIWNKLKINKNMSDNMITYNVDKEEHNEERNIDKKSKLDKFDIKYLPTVYFVSGNKSIEYKGDRKVKDLLEFWENN